MQHFSVLGNSIENATRITVTWDDLRHLCEIKKKKKKAFMFLSPFFFFIVLVFNLDSFVSKYSF